MPTGSFAQLALEDDVGGAADVLLAKDREHSCRVGRGERDGDEDADRQRKPDEKVACDGEQRGGRERSRESHREDRTNARPGS